MRENNKVSVIHIADKTLDNFRCGKNTNFDACIYSETLDTTLIQLRAAEDLIDARWFEKHNGYIQGPCYGLVSSSFRVSSPADVLLVRRTNVATDTLPCFALLPDMSFELRSGPLNELRATGNDDRPFWSKWRANLLHYPMWLTLFHSSRRCKRRSPSESLRVGRHKWLPEPSRQIQWDVSTTLQCFPMLLTPRAPTTWFVRSSAFLLSCPSVNLCGNSDDERDGRRLQISGLESD